MGVMERVGTSHLTFLDLWHRIVSETDGVVTNQKKFSNLWHRNIRVKRAVLTNRCELGFVATNEVLSVKCWRRNDSMK